MLEVLGKGSEKKNKKFLREGGVNDFGIWGGHGRLEHFGISESKGGGGLKCPCRRGRVWIFSGITHLRPSLSLAGNYEQFLVTFLPENTCSDKHECYMYDMSQRQTRIM